MASIKYNPTFFNNLQKYSLTAEKYSSVMAKTKFKTYNDFVENNRCIRDLAQSIGITSNLKTHNFVPVAFQEEHKEKLIDIKSDVENIKTRVKETNISTTSNSLNSTNVKEYYSVNSKDQLFWCLMMIINSWDEEDLPESRDRFEYESKQKTELTEMLQKTKDIPWRNLKLSRTAATTGLGSSINGKMGVNELRALGYLFEKNIIYTWGRTYISIPGGKSEASDSNSDKWHVILKKRDGIKLATDDYAKVIMKQVENKEIYRVDDPSKPLLSEATYKLDELQEMAKKFDIIITRENGKNKTKNELYNEIINIIQKID